MNVVTLQGTKGEWKRCDRDLPYARDITSTVEIHSRLRRQGYPALIYSGDHDSKFPFVGTQAWIRSLNLSITDDWRPWPSCWVSCPVPAESSFFGGLFHGINLFSPTYGEKRYLNVQQIPEHIFRSVTTIFWSLNIFAYDNIQYNCITIFYPIEVFN
uniref:Uncharacterized protein n=1 Tax=Aegilops tauschii subsp. strangulata TaxID=200361 RepID=A0A453C2U1_AEGTS